jgi:tRNA threonylcarbamoyladenosine biosynthesis protein TsaB
MFERVLVLETSGKVGQVALGSGQSIVAEHRLDGAHRRASDLTLVVDRLLKEQNWKARDLTAVVVGLGPGSYTGLRVGLASAKALAYATGCSFFGVETFAAIAYGQAFELSEVTVVGDALQGKLFHRSYRRDADGNWQPSSPLGIIAAGSQEGTVVVANEPRPIDLLGVAANAPWAVTTDLWRAEPYYLRGSSAEEKVKNEQAPESGG